MSPNPRQFVLLEREEAVVTLTLNRPEKRNALCIEVMEELTSALEEVGDSDARGIILAARGPVFSAGHNFGDMAGANLARARHLFQVCTRLMETLQRIPQPVLAKVHALATAAGCQLVASCDLALASETAGFALPGGKSGLFCHTPLVAVARQVGRKRALQLAMTGEVIDARTAADWGLVNGAVPADQLDTAARELLGRCIRGSPLSKGLGKQTFYAQIDLPQHQAYALAVETMAAGALTPDGQETIAAFLEKRAPSFREHPGTAPGRSTHSPPSSARPPPSSG